MPNLCDLQCTFNIRDASKWSFVNEIGIIVYIRMKIVANNNENIPAS